MTGLSQLDQRAVKPFYRSMMGLNAIGQGADLSAVAAVGRGTTDVEVVELLHGLWRPRVMGAWLAAGRTAPGVLKALATGLATSGGTLTAPALVSVAVLQLGPEALPALHLYLERALADPSLGAHEFTAAALERLDAPVPTDLVTGTAREALDRMLAVGRTLAELSLGT